MRRRLGSDPAAAPAYQSIAHALLVVKQPLDLASPTVCALTCTPWLKVMAARGCTE